MSKSQRLRSNKLCHNPPERCNRKGGSKLLLIVPTFTRQAVSSALRRPFNNLQCKHDQDQGAGEDHDDVACGEKVAHGAHEDAVDLADLGELQCRRSACKQEADDDEDGVVENADGNKLCDEGQHRGHDDRRENHARQQRRVEEFALFGFGFGRGSELVLGKGVNTCMPI